MMAEIKISYPYRVGNYSIIARFIKNKVFTVDLKFSPAILD